MVGWKPLRENPADLIDEYWLRQRDMEARRAGWFALRCAPCRAAPLARSHTPPWRPPIFIPAIGLLVRRFGQVGSTGALRKYRERLRVNGNAQDPFN